MFPSSGRNIHLSVKVHAHKHFQDLSTLWRRMRLLHPCSNQGCLDCGFRQGPTATGFPQLRTLSGRHCRHSAHSPLSHHSSFMLGSRLYNRHSWTALLTIYGKKTTHSSSLRLKRPSAAGDEKAVPQTMTSNHRNFETGNVTGAANLR